MKKIKKIILTGIVTMMMLTMYSPTDAYATGPLESYLDCAIECIEKYNPWTIRRTLCAADCYFKFWGDVVKLASPV
jgi:hypothetical protein